MGIWRSVGGTRAKCRKPAVALPRMLAQVEADLAIAGPQHRSRLREHAKLIRGLLTPSGDQTQGYPSP
jgi:hypothetical protein